RGYDGWHSDCASPAEPGDPGIHCYGSARLHLSLSSTVGGRGGNGCGPFQSYSGENGGAGIYASSGGSVMELLLCGSASVGSATGGVGGSASGGPSAGSAGASLTISGPNAIARSS